MSELPHTPELHEHPDPWHEHTPKEPPPQPEHAARVNPAGLFVAFVAIVLSVVATTAIVALYFYQTFQDQRVRVVETTTWSAEAWDGKHQRQRVLESPANATEEAGVEVGIDEAMSRIVERYGSQ